MENRWSQIDKTLALLTFFLMGLGLVQVYSASFVHATEMYGDGLLLFKKQLFFTFLGIITMMVVALNDWKNVKMFGIFVWVVAVIGIVLTLTSGLAVKAGGATRWIALPFGFRFEPSELLKVTYPFLLAAMVSPKFQKLHNWQKGIAIAALSSPLVMLIQQPDFGSIAIVLLMGLGVLFVFGLPWKKIGLLTMGCAGVFFALIYSSPYRMNRVKVFLDPWRDPTDSGFQVIQSMLTFHSGKLWGRGLGQGQGKLFFLPEAHTDFTLAAFAEEMGFVGFCILLVVYFLFVYRGLRIAALTKDTYAKAVAAGVSLILFFNIFINMGVALGMLPTKGLTLPFLSYGGSSLVTISFAVGILLSIDRMRRIEQGDSSHSFYRVN